jgi:hypothetical protein
MPEGFVVNDIEHLESQCPAYGLYDTQDNCWLGDETGPKLYTRELVEKLNGLPLHTAARIAAQMIEVQLGYAPGRLQPREFNGENLVLKDEVPTLMTAEEALTRLEGGTTNGEEIIISGDDIGT